MSLFAMQLTNAFSSRELSNSQNLLKNSIHKLSSGKRLVQSRDDTGMLSVQMKMNADSYRDASTMGQIGNAVSFLDMQDDMLSNAQNILTRMSELKGLSINDPMKSKQDIDAYNNEFHDLQKQLYQLSKQTFNGTSLFATTTEKMGGEEVLFKGVGNERNIITLTTDSSTISIQKLAFIDSLKLINPDPVAVENHTVKLSPTVDLEMIRVEPGTFIMGSPLTETGRRSNERQYNVTISKEFYLGKYEVTQEQWHDIMLGNENGISSNPSRWDWNPNRPVEDISWNDIQTFINRLNEQQSKNLPGGWKYDLPTEAEWEYAARSGTTTAYPWGNTIDSSRANYSGSGYRQTRDVGQYDANPWGFYDMHGNVYEWTDSGYGSYPTEATLDPLGNTVSGSKVMRGGSYLYNAAYNRSSYRDSRFAGYSHSNRGFRIALRKENSDTEGLGSMNRLTAINDKEDVLNLSDFQTSYFNQAIENISYLRSEASATNSRLEFTGDSIQNLKTLSSTAIGRILDIDYAMENSKLAKQKILSSSSAAMIAQANSMGDVLLTMLN